jgi:hypothetical protein
MMDNININNRHRGKDLVKKLREEDNFFLGKLSKII